MRAGVAPWLVVLQDVLAGERVDHALVTGARLSDELMRLFPEGIEGRWRLYNREVDTSSEIEREQASRIVLSPNDLVILVRVPEAQTLVQLGIAIVLSFIAHVLTPVPNRPRAPQALAEQQESGTNQLAAQQNVLRPGARVPDILGRLRVYPDLLTNPIEVWTWPTTQTITQYFVIGVGNYDLTDAKLGETPITAITSASPAKWRPDEDVPVEPIPVVRFAPTVDNLSLDAVLGEGDVATGLVGFFAGPNTLVSDTQLGLVVGEPINVASTLFNNGDYFVTSVPPPEQTSGPYTYTLDGDVVADESVVPAITRFAPFGGTGTIPMDASMGVYLTAWTQIYFGPPEYGNPSPGPIPFALLAEALHAGNRYVGRIVDVYYRYDEPTTNVSATDMHMPANIYRAPMNFPDWSFENTVMRMWSLPPGVGLTSRVEPMPRADAVDPLFTAWMVAALPEPDELWFDIGFPQGLIEYISGSPFAFSVNVIAEFRRVGTTAPVVTRAFPTFSETRRVALRRTVMYKVAGSDPEAINLPGSGPIEVRLKRTTPIPADSSTHQYQSETRWISFRAMKLLPARKYPEVTIFRLGLQNTRSAASLGENSFNVIATRVVRSWNGSAWTTAVGSDKWADNFLERVTSRNGASRDDDEIDLAGIRALQLALDDPAYDGGAQGKIALALDQQQDIDAELAQIADVVRAVVYRVGRKLYVSRDQANATPIALFNGRTKSAEGETVSIRMKSDDENDAIQVQWYDEAAGWKLREYVYSDPPNPQPSNVLRVAPVCANWPQAFRRAVYEWNKIRYRREQLAVSVTEDGRICRPGDVVHVTDDVANLAIAAGEVLYISGLTLVVDHDLDFSAPGTYSILLRDVEGAAVDVVPCNVVTGSSNRVQLARAPTVAVKGRDEALGTLYAFYNDAAVITRKWLLTSVEASGQQVTLAGVNYSARVYAGDALALPPRPPLVAT